MKTIIFFTAKRARTPKMQGLATAAGSASIIRELCRLARRGKGRVYLVDAPTAEHGRRRIAAYRAGEKPDIGAPPMTTVLDNGRRSDRGRLILRGTGGSNLLPSSGESSTNLKASHRQDRGDSAGCSSVISHQLGEDQCVPLSELNSRSSPSPRTPD